MGAPEVVLVRLRYYYCTRRDTNNTRKEENNLCSFMINQKVLDKLLISVAK